MGVKSGDRDLILMVVADVFRAKQWMGILYWGLENSWVGEREGASREKNFEMNEDGGAEEGRSWEIRGTERFLKRFVCNPEWGYVYLWKQYQKKDVFKM